MLIVVRSHYYYYYYFEGCKHGRIDPILLVGVLACLIQRMLQKMGLGFKGYEEQHICERGREWSFREKERDWGLHVEADFG